MNDHEGTASPGDQSPRVAGAPPFSGNIREIQVLLLSKGYDLAIDGFNGPRTHQAVRAFQARAGLEATGECDPDTWGALHG